MAEDLNVTAALPASVAPLFDLVSVDLAGEGDTRHQGVIVQVPRSSVSTVTSTWGSSAHKFSDEFNAKPREILMAWLKKSAAPTMLSGSDSEAPNMTGAQQMAALGMPALAQLMSAGGRPAEAHHIGSQDSSSEDSSNSEDRRRQKRKEKRRAKKAGGKPEPAVAVPAVRAPEDPLAMLAGFMQAQASRGGTAGGIDPNMIVHMKMMEKELLKKQV